jgi:leader peptidase (prepilin peptidase)/N-methyltransferase
MADSSGIPGIAAKPESIGSFQFFRLQQRKAPLPEPLYWFVIVFSFLFGLILGSFLNAVIYRLPREISIAKGRSMCPHCQHPLAPPDLIPLFSFLALRGHCRYCRAPISWRYPLVELLSGGGLVLLFILYGWSVAFFQWSFFYLLLVPLVFIDLDFKLLPDVMTLPGIALGLLFQSIQGNWLWSLVGAAACGGVYLLITLLWKEGMGGGDVKLAAMIGAFLAYPLAILWFVIGFLVGAIGGVIGIAFFKLKGKSAIPFGPYMAVGAFITLFWGNQIIAWYLSLMGL